MDSLGRSVRRAATTVRPPMPESKTPIGREFSAGVPGLASLLAGIDGNGGWMQRVWGQGLVGTQRLADRTGVRRQICFRDREVGHAGTVIHSRVIILNALGNGSPELLPIVCRGDALPFRGIADESSLEQDRRDFDVAQDMEARMAHPAIENRNP